MKNEEKRVPGIIGRGGAAAGGAGKGPGAETSAPAPSIRQFAEEAASDLQAHYGKGYEVCIQEVSKLNGVILTGITIRNLSHDGPQAVPTLYMDGYYYSQYLDGRRLSDICREISAAYEESRDSFAGVIGKQDFLRSADEAADFSLMKSRVCFRLINTKMNKRLLAGMPHRDFLDLSVIYYISFQPDGEKGMLISLTNALMEQWGTSEEELYSLAAENTPALLGLHTAPLDELVRKCAQAAPDPEAVLAALPEAPEDAPVMYGATNRECRNGAAVLLYDGFLDDFCRDRDCRGAYVLPSSIHEVILLPDWEERDEEIDRQGRRLLGMVMEINRTQVPEEEVLADTVYYYDRERGEIRGICCIEE